MFLFPVFELECAGDSMLISPFESRACGECGSCPSRKSARSACKRFIDTHIPISNYKKLIFETYLDPLMFKLQLLFVLVDDLLHLCADIRHLLGLLTQKFRSSSIEIRLQLLL